MATTEYINNIAQCLEDGNLSDLTVESCGRTWRVHKVIVCCHSKWFQTAITSEFKEASSPVIRLLEEPELGHALDCMVSYFYRAQYEADKYDTPAALLHAQVAVVADKYDCASLRRLASSRFSGSMEQVDDNEWHAVADFIYSHTTTENLDHLELQRSIICAFGSRRSLRISAMRNENIVEMLRGNGELATDLLLSSPDGRRGQAEQTFTCDKCHYIHVGRSDCSQLSGSVESAVLSGISSPLMCPQCSNTGETAKRITLSVRLQLTVDCAFCGGVHTDPASEPEPEFM